MDFSSVNEFLKAARSAKKDQEAIINEKIEPFMDDPSTIGITPELSESIDDLVEKYGDEALRATAMFCIGKWLETHREILEQHCMNDDLQAALWVMNDISKLSLVLQTMEDISSFGGDDDWRKMLKKVVSQAVLENCEERGINPEDLLS
jgi:hypothetical protein